MKRPLLVSPGGPVARPIHPEIGPARPRRGGWIGGDRHGRAIRAAPDRAEVAAALGPIASTKRRSTRRARSTTRWSCSPTPPETSTSGTGTTSGSPTHTPATSGCAVQCADADGLRRLRAAGRERGDHPRHPPHKWTLDNIARMERQIRSIGGVYDWSKEIATCLPEYYKWNQWFFLKFYERGLAYRSKARSTGARRTRRSWPTSRSRKASASAAARRSSSATSSSGFFRITNYADELLDFSEIDWPERSSRSSATGSGGPRASSSTSRSTAAPS